MTPLPSVLLDALRGRDEVLVGSRSGTRVVTVPMNFALGSAGALYLMTSAFSRKARRWVQDPWARLTVPGTEVGAEGSVRAVRADEIDPETEAAILERFASAGAATPEALRQLLEIGTHRLFRVEGPAEG